MSWPLKAKSKCLSKYCLLINADQVFIHLWNWDKHLKKRKAKMYPDVLINVILQNSRCWSEGPSSAMCLAAVRRCEKLQSHLSHRIKLIPFSLHVTSDELQLESNSWRVIGHQTSLLIYVYRFCDYQLAYGCVYTTVKWQYYSFDTCGCCLMLTFQNRTTGLESSDLCGGIAC